MQIQFYCTNCTFALLADVGLCGKSGYCPNCGAPNRSPDPADQCLEGSGAIVARASSIQWYFGSEPSHQRESFENAISHVGRVAELLGYREEIAENAIGRLQACVTTDCVPGPDGVSQDHVQILQAAYTCARLPKLSNEHADKLLSHARRFDPLFARRLAARSLYSRFLRRSFAEVELEVVSREFDQLCADPIALDLIALYEAESEELLPPTELPELVEDYRCQFAAYTATIESVSKDVVLVDEDCPFAHGGLPAEIARAVESVKLCVDKLRITLRGYQEFGTKYIVHQERTILGDEMGVGKTIQAMAAMAHLNAVHSANRFLVVAPASIIHNWKEEICNKSHLHCHVLHGKDRDTNVKLWNDQGGIGVTSFSTLWSLDIDLTKEIELLVVDEAHYIKNQNADRSRLTEQLAQCSKRVCLMTGTPLENHVHEFVNLVRMCAPEISEQLVNDPAKGDNLPPNVDQFREQVAPVYLRRNQQDVLPELPDAIEIEEWVNLDGDHREAYDDTLQRWNIQDRRQAANGYTTSSPKMTRLKELIDDYREQGRKVVVFSNFIKTLDLAGEVIGEHLAIRGNVSPSKRTKIVNQFNKADGAHVLIGQIEACGVGHNLHTASAVILMEPQFKPTSEWQAFARLIRMGQTRSVNIHRLLAVNTVDENLRKLVQEKARSFDTYAKESAVKSASDAAVDHTHVDMTHQLLKMEH